MISEDATCRALIPVIPMVDTLKILKKEVAEDGVSRLVPITGKHVDRAEVFGAQTPQVSGLRILRRPTPRPMTRPLQMTLQWLRNTKYLSHSVKVRGSISR